ncbi:MAG: hypothetical protein A4E57_00834 [Syntrophorhabdaceae bacterium PtaU1.Bin034]|nr:MAG: hypothetical protein A4E57_00834 [Syntrophorhabdaceae bacterium PtaU1.Bin034]
MPRGDGTGPMGGRAAGCGRNTAAGGRAGAGMRGRGAGPGTEVVCSRCGTKAPKERGVPCFEQKCPTCGSAMARV